MIEPELFKNLKALEDASFPKACTSCGKQYENEAAFVNQTSTCHEAPCVVESKDQDGKAYIRVARQCSCGQAILDHFGNRRDTSTKGEFRRQAFEKVVQQLVKQGISPARAREELINHMQNKKSALLEQLGVFNR